MSHPRTTAIARQPLLFEENKGQLSPDCLCCARGQRGAFLFSKHAITSILAVSQEDQVLSGVVISLSFLNANVHVQWRGMDQTQAQIHHLKGAEASAWYTHIATFRSIRYERLWEGISLVVSSCDSGLKLYWHLDAPSALSTLKLRWEGGHHLALDDDGSMVLKHAMGELRDPKPYAYQMVDGKEMPIACDFCLQGDTDFGFVLSGDYDASAPVVIDPLIPYATYLGGNGTTSANDIGVDEQGCSYVTGYTSSVDFPTTPGAFQITNSGGSDAYVSKFAPDGKSLVYSTYLGGSGTDVGNGIAVDSQGYAYVVGDTTSSNFPVTPGAFQDTIQGTRSAFVTKIALDGESLLYSTYLGGSSDSSGKSIALDALGHSYVAGSTESVDFPVTPGAFQTALLGSNGGFVAKLALDGGSLQYASLLGGSSSNEIMAIAVDSVPCAYVTGYTDSADFPVTPGAFQTALTGSTCAIITKFTQDGSALVYSSFVGGSVAALAYGIAVNAQGNAVITGYTNAPDFPITPGALQTTLAGNSNAIIFVMSQPGDALLASTFLGGSGTDFGTKVALDASSRVYITGSTNSLDFPTTPSLIPSAFSGERDAFVSILSADVSTLLVSFYLGGAKIEAAHGIALGKGGSIYTAGETYSNDFPVTPDAFQPTLHGFIDGYVTRNIIQFVEVHRATLTIMRVGDG